MCSMLGVAAAWPRQGKINLNIGKHLHLKKVRLRITEPNTASSQSYQMTLATNLSSRQSHLWLSYTLDLKMKEGNFLTANSSIPNTSHLHPAAPLLPRMICILLVSVWRAQGQRSAHQRQRADQPAGHQEAETAGVCLGRQFSRLAGGHRERLWERSGSCADSEEPSPHHEPPWFVSSRGLTNLVLEHADTRPAAPAEWPLILNRLVGK